MDALVNSERGHWTGRALILAVSLLAILPTLVGAARETHKEYQVKAVFLFHFAQFVDWPERAFTGPDQALVIGVLGADPFGDYLDLVVRGEKKRNRDIVVKRFARPDEMGGCHILFLSRSEDGDLERTLGGLKGKGVLTVGETDGFNRSGGMMRFSTQGTRIRVKVNLEAVQAEDLMVSSKLLRLADIVPPEKGGP